MSLPRSVLARDTAGQTLQRRTPLLRSTADARCVRHVVEAESEQALLSTTQVARLYVHICSVPREGNSNAVYTYPGTEADVHDLIIFQNTLTLCLFHLLSKVCPME